MDFDENYPAVMPVVIVPIIDFLKKDSFDFLKKYPFWNVGGVP
jgi:hypothetical protein